MPQVLSPEIENEARTSGGSAMTQAKETGKFSKSPMLLDIGTGRLPLIRALIPRRILEKIEVKPSGCWYWKGSQFGLPGYKYGEVRTWNPQLKGKARAGKTSAHRFVYQMVFGPVSPDLDVDHLCHNKLCVNPEHLEAVTHQENIVRMYRRQRAAR